MIINERHKILKLILYVFLTCSICSCKKEIEFEIPLAEQKLVVDGWIEQGRYARVFLTKSCGYFEEVDSVKMVDLVVRFAKVTLDDGQDTEVLTLKRDETYFPPYYYQSTKIKGEIGKTYSLRIDFNYNKYLAKTSIKSPVSIDSIYFVINKDNQNKGFLNVEFTDPIGDNYYRIYTKRLGKDKDYRPIYFPTFNDRTYEGKKAIIQMVRGPESNSELEDDLYYDKGDSVMVRFTSLDKEHFNFWKYTDSRAYVSSNPFAISTNDVVSNIENGLGVWGGFGSTYYLFVVK